MFLKAGSVTGRTLEFTLEGNLYRIEASEPIAVGGTREIYVFHQRNFEMNPASAEWSRVAFGAAGHPGLYRD